MHALHHKMFIIHNSFHLRPLGTPHSYTLNLDPLELYSYKRNAIKIIFTINQHIGLTERFAVRKEFIDR